MIASPGFQVRCSVMTPPAGGVPAGYYEIPEGQPAIRRAGKDLSIATLGATLYRAMEAAAVLEAEYGLSAEVIDLRFLNPLDYGPLVESVKKTGRCVVVHESPRNCGPAAEIIARIVETSLMYLEAPIRRVTGYDLVLPYFNLERPYMPDSRKVVTAARNAVAF